MGFEIGYFGHEIRLFGREFKLILSNCISHIFQLLSHGILHHGVVVALLSRNLTELLVEHLDNLLPFTDFLLMAVVLIV